MAKKAQESKPKRVSHGGGISTTVKVQAKVGRPTSYKPEYAKQAEKLCILGATDDDLADFFGVSDRTITRWQIKHQEFCRSLKVGKAESDDRVERSLFHKAVGYSFDSEKVFQFQGEVVRAKTREHVPPDTTAMIFWLKNRRPHDWREKMDVTTDGQPIPAPVIQIMPPRGDQTT